MQAGWLQWLLEVKQPGPALHGVAERHCLRLPAPCWHRRRASAGAGPRSRTSASVRRRADARAGGVRVAWWPARRLQARHGEYKGWEAFVALRSGVRSAKVATPYVRRLDSLSETGSFVVFEHYVFWVETVVRSITRLDFYKTPSDDSHRPVTL